MAYGLAYVLAAIICFAVFLSALTRRGGQPGGRFSLILFTLGGGWLCFSLFATTLAVSLDEVLPWIASVRVGLSIQAAGGFGVAWLLVAGGTRRVVTMGIGVGIALAAVGVAVVLSLPSDAIEHTGMSWFTHGTSIRLFDSLVTGLGSSAIAAGAVYRYFRGIRSERPSVLGIALVPIAAAAAFSVVRLFGGAELDRIAIPLLVVTSALSYGLLLERFRVAGVGTDALGLLFEHLPAPSVVIDLQTENAILNPAARALFGEEHCPDRLLTRLGLTEPAVEALNHDAKGVLPSVRLDGNCDRVFDLQFHSDEDKGVVLLVLIEVSERVRQTEELARTVNELHQMQDRLILQEKMAALGILVAGVNHEINNPLAFVTSNVRALKEYVQALASGVPLARAALGPDVDAAAGRLREWLDSVEVKEAVEDGPFAVDEALDGCARIRETVGSMRLLSRREEAQQVVDLNELARAGVKIGRTSFGPGIELHSELDTPIQVRGVAGELSRVVTNLVVNAGQALGGRGHIWVRSAIEKEVALLWVRDDGPGIPLEHRKRIFEPFFTTKPPGQGTGLGLAISYEAIRRHGGDLRLIDVVGPGACFEIRIPLADPEERSGVFTRTAA